MEGSLEVRQDFRYGQLVTLEGILRYREVEDKVNGTTLKHRIAEIHALSVTRLSKVETADDP
jgi:single-strand DNA-binding protein